MKHFYRVILVTMIALGIIGGFSFSNAQNDKEKININTKYDTKKADRIKSSIKQKNNYRFLISSNDSLDSIENFFVASDKKAKVKQYGENTFMVKLSKSNELLADIISDIDGGILPTTLGDYNIIQPEIVEGFGTGYVLGEETGKLWGNNLVGADAFQEELSTAPKIKVGVLDTGIDSTHSDLDANYNSSLSYDFVNEDTDASDDNGHGTQVAGIIGAEVNASGRYGVNSNSDLVSLKVLDLNGIGTSYDILEAIDYAKLNDIKVLNMSFGGIGSNINNPVCDAITSAKTEGIISVTSAGNSNSSIADMIPASCPDIITVGAIDEQNEKTLLSNYGTGVSLYAPGENIYTTTLDNLYSTVEGTSYASAFVSGLISKEFAMSGSIDTDTLLLNLHTHYNLMSSIYDPSEFPYSDTYTGTGEVMSYTGAELPMTFGEPGVFVTEGNMYPWYYTNGKWNCYLVDYANFSNGYQLRSYVKYHDLTKNIGRTELWKNGVMLEYQDNVFYANRGYQAFSGNSCYLMSRFRSVVLDDAGIIHISYNFWNGFRWIYNVQPTKFNINEKKNITDVSVTTSVFGYPKHFYVKLNLKDNNISSTINIASQGYLDNTWSGYTATRSTWLWGGRYFASDNPCSIDISDGGNDNYIVNYSCTVYMNRSGGAANGYQGSSVPAQITGSFDLSKEEYDLCDYDAQFCLSQSPFDLWQRLIDARNKSNGNNSETGKPDTNSTGDPVLLHSGEFIYDNVVMQHTSQGFPFELEVNYKNQISYEGVLGYNFDHSYNQYLEEQSDGNINYYDGKLGMVQFVNNGTSFDYNTDINAQLELINGKYQIVFNHSKTYVFNTDLKLETISDNFGNTMSFAYNTDGNLSTIIDTNGRLYSLLYNTNNKLASITDFNGDSVEFIYYGAGDTDGTENDLKTIKIVNGVSSKEIVFTYTIGIDDISSHNIIKLIDSENNIYVDNTYDSDDRVATQMFGSGTISYSYTTNTEGNIIQNNVIDREGNNVIYTYDSNGNNTSKLIKKVTGDSLYTYEYNTDNYLIKETLPLGNGYTYSYDTNGNLTEKRQKSDISTPDSSDDIVMSYTYDLDFNKPTQIISPNGTITNFVLDTNGNVTSKEILGVNDIDGVSQTIIENYNYNTLGEIIQKTDANNNTISFEYSSGSLVKSTRGAGTTAIITEYSYDTNGSISSITDGEGSITHLSYDDFNMLESLTTPEGIVSEYTYNKLNKKVNESIILGDLSRVSTSYEYDILDKPTSITRDIDTTRQKVTVSNYDKNNNITEIIDGNSARVQFEYNEQSYITKKIIINGSQNIITSYEYDINNRLVKQINPNGSETTFSYDLYDRIIKQTLSNGVYTTLSYDKAGNILETKTYSSTGVLLQHESNIFDGLNRGISNTKHSVSDTTKITTKIYFDVVGNRIKTIDAKGIETIYEYDEFNRLSQVTDALGNIISNTYNKNDKLVSRTITGTGGTSISTSYGYDSDNRLVSETNNLGESVSYSYNNLNQVVSKTDKDNGVTTYTYDYVGNILSESHEGKIISYTYDIDGNKTSVTDANNVTTQYSYDSLNRLTGITYTDGNSMSYDYDISGNLIQTIDPNGTIVTNNYDSLNRLTSRTIQTGTGVIGVTSENYIYDDLGRLISATDSEGNAVEFDFDSFNRLISENNSNEIINYNYDVNGNITQLNSISYSHDIANRLLGVKNGTQSIADYNYDSLSLQSQVLGNGVTTSYSYDALQRLESLGDYNYSYNTQGNITSDGIDYYSYDELDRITGVNYDQVNIPEYNGDKIERFFYDAMGNRTSQENYTLKDVTTETCSDETVVEDVTLSNGKTKTVERKVQVCETAVTQVEKQKNTLSYDTNPLNQYATIQNLNKNGEVKKEFTYEYDNNGNLSKDDINQYFYDYKNRLVKVIQNEVIKVDEAGNILEIIPEEEIVNFEYDILGRRIEKKTEDKLIQYIYAGQQAIQENTYSFSGTELILTETRKNIYSNNLDDILSTIVTNHIDSTTEQYYFEKNHLGSITKITDITGAIVEQYEYDTFGVAYASVNNVEAVTTAQNKKTLSIKKGNGSETANDGNTDELTIDNIRYKRYNGKGKIGNTRLYTGREYDAELKLYYNRARYYSPDLGRFISRDPIDISDDVNLYGYVGNSPLMYIDSNGMSKALIIGFNGMDYSSKYGGINDRNDKFASSIGVASEEVSDLFNLGGGKYFDSGISVDTKLYNSSIAGSATNGLIDYIIDGNYDKIVIFGHSIGADTAVEFSNRLSKKGISVDLLITIDLYATRNTTSLEDNILNAENYYQTNGVNDGKDRFGLITGAEELTRSKDNTITNITNTKVNTRCSIYECSIYDTDKPYYHQTIDDGLVKDKIIQNSIINAIIN